MSYWLPHIAVDADQLLRFYCCCCRCCAAAMRCCCCCARAQLLRFFFKLTKTKCLPMQFAAVRASAQAHMLVCVWLCVSIVYLGNATCLTYIFMFYVSQYSCENESVLLLFALPTHSRTHCTCVHIHVCVCLICIQSEFQLTFEFCTFCNANVMLTVAERTLSITMRALSFHSLSLVVQCR